MAFLHFSEHATQPGVEQLPFDAQLVGQADWHVQVLLPVLQPLVQVDGHCGGWTGQLPFDVQLLAQAGWHLQVAVPTLHP
jgi:hypothetical protein